MPFPIIPNNITPTRGVFSLRGNTTFDGIALIKEITGTTTYAGNLGSFPIVPGSFRLNFGDPAVYGYIVDDGAGSFTDNSIGNFITEASSTIDYATGAYSIVFSTILNNRIDNASWISTASPFVRYDLEPSGENVKFSSGNSTIELYVTNLGTANVSVQPRESSDTISKNDNAGDSFKFERSFTDLGSVSVIKPLTTAKLSINTTKKFLQLVSTLTAKGSVRVQGFFPADVTELSYFEPRTSQPSTA